MKIVAFSDVHANKKALENLKRLCHKEKPELLLCAGDISIFENGLDEMLYEISRIGTDIGIEIYIVHGNHEDEHRMSALASFFEKIEFVHGRIRKYRDSLIVGHGGGGFTQIDAQFEKHMNKLIEMIEKERKKSHMSENGSRNEKREDERKESERNEDERNENKRREDEKRIKKLIMITHAPPYGTTVDKSGDNHRGNKSYRRFIDIAKPELVICGHFHEHARKQDKIGKTIVVNPGPEGVVIEI